jgi:2,4-dienoyl-CoA reductase-like NADH-dependent reductase (Old Yellow Enzyme family)
MSILFEPVKIGRLVLKNRFVRSATYFALSDDDGYVSQAEIDLMQTLARNEIGLIVTGFAYVLKNGQGVPDMCGIQDDDHIPGYRKMTEAVHRAGGLVAMQIVHCGMNAYTMSFWHGDYMAVSVFKDMPEYRKKAREMTGEDIEAIIEAFGQAARRVEEAGFDGVQIHGAHGYLVSQFLSPYSNRRRDEWGGDLENRMRFVLEVAKAIKRNVSTDFPVMIKLGVRDYFPDRRGLTVEEGGQVAQALEKEGVCLVEISSGFSESQSMQTGIRSPEKEAYFLPQALYIRGVTSGPLCLVGGMRSLPVMEAIIRSGVASCVSLSRPLIREPDLIKRWKAGDTRPADCISCGGCFNRIGKGRHSIHCRQLRKRMEEASAS